MSGATAPPAAAGSGTDTVRWMQCIILFVSSAALLYSSAGATTHPLGAGQQHSYAPGGGSSDHVASAANEAVPSIGLGTLDSPCTGMSDFVRRQIEDVPHGECKALLLDDSETTKDLMIGQYGQDAWIFYNVARCMHAPGRYLDIGAYNPKKWSNTFLLDWCLNWEGICAEADPQQAAPFFTDRRCHVVPKAISLTSGDASLSGGDWSGSVQPGNVNAGGAVTKMTTMAEVLKEVKWLPEAAPVSASASAAASPAPRVRIDFMSLDVESHELPVLIAMPWEQLDVRFIILENNYLKFDVNEYLQDQHYVRVGNLVMDEIYARLPVASKLWWPSDLNATRMDVAGFRRDQGHPPYQHKALYRGWDAVGRDVAATKAFPEK